MKAIIFKSFGSSQVLETAEVPTPAPRAGEVLVAITHTSVNPVDWKIREGQLSPALPHGFPLIPGWDVAGVVDGEVKALLTNAHQEAFEILVENRDVLDDLVLQLLDKETLDKAEIAAVFEPLRRRPMRPAWTGSPDREPSSIPPVDIPQAVKDKAGSNGAGHDQEGAIVLTPPGSGGDVHGDPGVSSAGD